MEQLDGDDAATVFELAPPPYYQPVRNLVRRQRSGRCAFIAKKTFLVVNSLLACFFLGGLVLILFTDTFPLHQVNMSKYCDLPGYNFIGNPQKLSTFESALLIVTFTPCFLVIAGKCYRDQGNSLKAILRFLWHCAILLMQLVFLSLLVIALKLTFGTPRPYIFGNKELKEFYCHTNWYHTAVPLTLKKVDYMMRTSFPSFRSSLYAFALTFNYLYIDRIEMQTGLHSAQQVVIIALGTQVCRQMISLWENGDSHLLDLMIGAVIGIIEGAIAIRSMFGTLLRNTSM